MEVRAIAKQQHISPFKAREVAREIQGLPVSRALDILNFTPKKAAIIIGKTLKSAIANAAHNHELEVNTLVVKTAIATEGGHMNITRSNPRARGSASPIKHRPCHITIVLSDEIEIPVRGQKSAGAPAKKSSPPTAE